MLVGLRILLIIAIMGGIIAYIGDKLGTRVGKRKMSLFGLRPKHTSIIVTIITGVLISAATLGVLTVASSTVRTALFGMEKLRAEMDQLNRDIEVKNKALLEGNQLLQDRTKQLERVQSDVKATEAELEETRQSLAAKGDELISIQDSYKMAEQQLASSAAELKALESSREKLQAHVSQLQITTKELEDNIVRVREGNIIFRNGEILAGSLIKPGLSVDEARVALTSFMNDTNGLILKRFGMTEEKSVLFISRSNLEGITEQVANSEVPMTVRIMAAGNIIYGEPALAELHAYPETLVFHKGDVLWSEVIEGGDNAREKVLGFLQYANSQAKEKGILPDPITGQVGTIPGDELFDTIRQVENYKGRLELKALILEDTYSGDTVHIELIITHLP